MIEGSLFQGANNERLALLEAEISKGGFEQMTLEPKRASSRG